ncbi:TetR/AcrR family transcriptional regulator [Rhodococcus sp. BP-149]|nr:TetR/AcrR family transcriptional regulator [Rhodococcus sp. BP-288]MBY6693781.1 TetR/AcrR family transcriptional regulator [Rhodococcus sp. BP-188]MBY6699622.1 TetR/AcrR family transcriptional regulator [Rhodococcus sp. BP-285]MBY6704033.1 TetR/AcrR family transcriptional regulator [Rhodococcus sp. BP-283]MBY6710818.1 TetR/AcrR family transcriptional regulator [Rhodococcus sp. BP-160]MBY6717790.1 TetR/AcrR family transcriptional regulator [Rhodococcus sp. BP-110]MBY6720357.1 TetR/AcrR fami
MEQVAVAAGVSRGAIYHHWNGKRALFADVVAHAQEIVGAAVAASSEGDGWDALEAGCAAFLAAAIAPEVRRILLVDGPAVLGWQEWRRSDTEYAGRKLAEGLRALPDLAVDADAATALLSGAMNDGALWIAEGGDPDAVLTALTVMLRGLRTPTSIAGS